LADNQRIEDLRRRVQKDPSSIAFAQLAEELRRAGQAQESVDVCRAGLDLHPGYLSAHVTLGRALIDLNQLDEALLELDEVLKSAPENLAAIRAVADIHHRRGDLAAALKHYRAALALARNDPDLEQTVSDLTKKVEPPRVPRASEGLSLAQAQDEFLKHIPPPPPPAPVPAASEPEPVVPLQAAHAEPEATEPAQIEADVQHGDDVEPEVPHGEDVEAEAPRTDDVEFEASPAAYVDAPPQEGDAAPAASQATEAETEPPVEPTEDPERSRATQTVAALEQWLDAIHVTRVE
jgi:tetratricopeptide (TPR) repeat protein